MKRKSYALGLFSVYKRIIVTKQYRDLTNDRRCSAQPRDYVPVPSSRPTEWASLPVGAGRVGLWGDASPPKRSQGRQPPSRCRQNESTACRGAQRRTRDVALFVGCNGCLLTLWIIQILNIITGHSSTGRRSIFSSNFYSCTKHIMLLRNFTSLVAS